MSRKNFSELTSQGQLKRIKKNADEELRSTFTEERDSIGFVTPIENLYLPDLSPPDETDDDIPPDEIDDDIPPDEPSPSPRLDSFFSDGLEDELQSMSENSRLVFALRSWAVNYRISLVALSALLCILRVHNCFSLPADARTLLHTPISVMVKVVSPGLYSHIGLGCGLKRIWDKVPSTVDVISVIIGIDGLPLFTSSLQSFWPILAHVSGVKQLKSFVFPVGIFFGKGKPDSCSAYLRDFVEEAVHLVENGIELNGKLVRVLIKGFVCDAPAKAFILGIKSHTGYSSCTRCMQRGTWFHNRVTFPKFDSPPRNHADFLSKRDEEFQIDDTPLVEIPNINFVQSFPLDYMHLICLGVMRTLFYTWISGPVPLKFQHRVIAALSSEFISLSDHIPLEFSRKPRSLSDIKRWKATEFRQALLYTGPIVFFNVLKTDFKLKYDHFLSLSIAMRILLNAQHCYTYLEYAKSLLIHFVKSTAKLYGPQYMTHNFHGLTHIADDVRTFGPLDSCSAFKFENYMQFLKKCIRKGDKPLQQLVKRLDEKSKSEILISNQTNYPVFSKPHFSGPLLSGCDANKQFGAIKFSTFKLTTVHPNSTCCLRNGNIVTVINIVFSDKFNGMVILCEEFRTRENFFSDPFMDSSVLGIFLLSGKKELKEVPISEISQKLVLLPFKNKHVAFPMIHFD